MKFTTEQRKHLVTRTFTENIVKFSAYNFQKNALVSHEEKVGGKFDKKEDMVKYICAKYSGAFEAVNPLSVEYEAREVKYAMYDYDFMRYGFILNDEDEKETE